MANERLTKAVELMGIEAARFLYKFTQEKVRGLDGQIEAEHASSAFVQTPSTLVSAVAEKRAYREIARAIEEKYIPKQKESEL